ncbi:hypothetical protein MKW98_017157 [Papaver atlanticum]|uniref:RING-type E3 ubiquitin transferase n=1 Tax=Papaver atlanticum TaxID=357466 RepID=A0AAD4SAU3_9MAGN|nr:hypothetical protein MKW98_017157 [Papaver atlanticum]
MGSFLKLIFIFISSFSFRNFVTSDDENIFPCPISSCSGNSSTPTVQYPFSIVYGDNQRDYMFGCVYPPGFESFDLSCSRNGTKMLLKLPSSEEFYVQDINYYTHKLQVSDPGGCLPKRYLQNVNLTGTPFESEAYILYNFCNCSIEGYTNLMNTYTNNSDSIFYVIDCLGSSTHKVLATVSRNHRSRIMRSMNSNNCELFDTDVLALARSDLSSDGDDFYPLTVKDFYLTWVLPEKITHRPGSRRTKIILGSLLSVFIGLPVLITFLCCYCPGIIKCFRSVCASRQRRRATPYFYSATVVSQPTVAPQPMVVRTGLTDSAIKSYPEVILGESGRLPNPNDTTCAICLSDFQPKETLKSMPMCNHCFHANCLEQWLPVNATCPVCRKSPLP